MIVFEKKVNMYFGRIYSCGGTCRLWSGKAVEETTVATSETGSESSTVLKGTVSKSSTGSDGADTILTITAGGSQVMLDEVRYYAYTAQATYETYYLTKGKEIDWDSKWMAM